MRRLDFIRELEQAGCILHRHGSRHDIYRNRANDKKAPLPPHRELPNGLCRLIRRQLGLTR